MTGVTLLFALLACLSVESPSGTTRTGRTGHHAPISEDPTDTSPSGDNIADTAEGTTPEVTPEVTILAPVDGAVVANPVAFRIALTDVDYAVLDADGYQIARVATSGASDVTYTFSGTGYTRVVTLTGYGADGSVIATDRISLAVEPEEVSLDVPYFYQYDNANEPGSTCGVTSAAMLVDWFHPGSVTPDSLYRAYGKSKGQAPESLASLYKAEGLHATWTYTGTRAEIMHHLDAGRPVVVHGYWTGSGHVTVIVGHSDTDWIVNDPAGDWYNCYGCGEADHVRYPIGGAWDDEMSWDGDVWYSTADTQAF